MLLAKVAHDELGGNMLAAIADSPSLPRRELEEAKEIAAEFGFPLEILRTSEFANEEYTSNPVNRCYFCKHELFTHLKPLASKREIRVIAYGENASDIGDWRPGSMAAEEFEVRAPLKEAQLSKDDIRKISDHLGLPTADKPQMPCLSSRIPYGEEVTREKVGMIEKAEGVLRDLGFRDVRVRHHATGPQACIEVTPGELDRLQESETLAHVYASLKAIGYARVQTDANGYRRGNLNPANLTE